jgi:hypothetical protein
VSWRLWTFFDSDGNSAWVSGDPDGPVVWDHYPPNMQECWPAEVEESPPFVEPWLPADQTWTESYGDIIALVRPDELAPWPRRRRRLPPPPPKPTPQPAAVPVGVIVAIILGIAAMAGALMIWTVRR